MAPTDLPTVIELMREFAEYEKLQRYFDVTEDKLHAVMFGDSSFVEGLIVIDDGTTVGYALFYSCFASFRGQRGIYLEDIYVATAFRGRGLGDAMLREIAHLALARGCERIDFQVLKWNDTAIGFYEKLGAVRNDEERHFKFTDRAFVSLTDRPA